MPVLRLTYVGQACPRSDTGVGCSDLCRLLSVSAPTAGPGACLLLSSAAFKTDIREYRNPQRQRSAEFGAAAATLSSKAARSVAAISGQQQLQQQQQSSSNSAYTIQQPTATISRNRQQQQQQSRQHMLSGSIQQCHWSCCTSC